MLKKYDLSADHVVVSWFKERIRIGLLEEFETLSGAWTFVASEMGWHRQELQGRLKDRFPPSMEVLVEVLWNVFTFQQRGYGTYYDGYGGSGGVRGETAPPESKDANVPTIGARIDFVMWLVKFLRRVSVSRETR